MFDQKKIFVECEGIRTTLRDVPWDMKLFGVNIYDLSFDETLGDASIHEFLSTIDDKARSLKVDLMTTRITQSNLHVINALEDYGFRYIEASYRPYLNCSDMLFSPSEFFSISLCTDSEVMSISEQISDMFKFGRYHQDERIPNKLADIRYKNWLVNSISVDTQLVYKCTDSLDATVAFFVVDKVSDSEAFLSLVGMMEAFRGKGLASSVWKTMLCYIKDRGYSKVSTSISSHNIAIFNLYVVLGFSFPEPELSFHKWYK